MTTHLEDDDIQTVWRGAKPSASATPDDAGRDDAPPTDAPGQHTVDDAPPTDAPGQHTVDDAPIG